MGHIISNKRNQGLVLGTSGSNPLSNDNHPHNAKTSIRKGWIHVIHHFQYSIMDDVVRFRDFGQYLCQRLLSYSGKVSIPRIQCGCRRCYDEKRNRLRKGVL
jgi:hypothetical protein